MSEDELSPGVKTLRKAVIIMGYVLVIGTIALFIAAYFKFTQKQTVQPTTAVAALPAPITQILPPIVEKCNFKPLADIAISGTILSSNINNNFLTIITKKKAKPVAVNKVQTGNSLSLTASTPESVQQIIIYDLCSGEILSTLNILEQETVK